MKPIRILIADDHGLLRLGLSTLLKFHKDLSVIGGAENGEEAIEQVRKLHPDVVIMDLMMPVMNGVEATRRIHRENPDIKVLILTTYGTSDDVSQAVLAGASGALVKDTPNDELIEAIRTVASGGQVFSPEIERQTATQSALPEFTPRQLEILESVARGFTNADIARLLAISSDAVKQHLTVICNKLGAANRAEAVAIAIRSQIV